MDRLAPYDKIGQTPVPDCVNADPTNGYQGSILNMLMFNQLNHEAVNLELLAGLSPDTANLFQWTQAVSRGGIWVDELTGTGDLAVATLDAYLPAFLRGMRLGAVAIAANTVTNPKLRVMNLNGVGLYQDFPIVKTDGSALVAGAIRAGGIYRFEADGAGNVMISGGGLATGGPTASVYFGAATGTNTLAATVTPAVSALADGMLFEIVPSATNTGASTLAINGLAALPVRYRDGTSEMIAGEFQANAPVLLMKLGSVFVLMSPPNPQRSALFSTSYPGAGFATSNNVAALFPMTAGSSSFGSHDGNSFTVTRPGLYLISATASTGIGTSGPANVNSQVVIYRNGAPLPGAGRSFDNSYDSSGVIAPTVTATVIVQLAAGDTISVYGVAYASANYTGSSNNSASLQIAALN